jgi:hypothetical protein
MITLEIQFLKSLLCLVIPIAGISKSYNYLPNNLTCSEGLGALGGGVTFP